MVEQIELLPLLPPPQKPKSEKILGNLKDGGKQGHLKKAAIHGSWSRKSSKSIPDAEDQ
jgi:hypothetical protein